MDASYRLKQMKAQAERLHQFYLSTIPPKETEEET